MRRLRALVLSVILAGMFVVGQSAPAHAVCPNSHDGGCDPCPEPEPIRVDLPRGLGFEISGDMTTLFDNCIQ
jgi:hypothetical protein